MRESARVIFAATLLTAASCTPKTATTLRSTSPARPSLGAPIDRIGRALTAQALLGLMAPDDVSDQEKEEYNRASVSDWRKFVGPIELSLGLYDGIDGVCGNQWLADRGTETPRRYRALAELLADDRLWIDSGSTVCTKYLAIELAELSTPPSSTNECGGRTPNENAVTPFRSLLVFGSTTGVDDGVDHDDKVHSTTDFPFLAAP